eukprot:evm.model.scf_942EXC.3 EVM.evm.TU.scf_942EXC.3   scf_942EXC:24897-28282(+)
MARGEGGRKRAVVVGGGFAGRRARRILQRSFDVTLIDAKGFFEFTPAALRCIVEPEHARRVVIPHPEGTRVGAVVKVNPGDVELSTGDRVPFDYCLICTGSSYTDPIKPDATTQSSAADRQKQFEAAHAQLVHAKKVVIVGGGTVGVELAAEVAGKWGKKKNVTLVASQERLLERMPAKASNYAAEWLRSKGVNLLLGEYIVDWGTIQTGSARMLKTDQGQVLEADVVYKCIGFAPCSEIVNPQDTETGQNRGKRRAQPIAVDKMLQVEGMRGVFSAGDCTSIAEEKTALTADLAATLAARNIERMDNGRVLMVYPEGATYGGSSAPCIQNVSLFKYSGIMQISSLVIVGALPALAKWLIEVIQMLMAREWWLAVWLWDWMESGSVLTARLLFA